MRRILADGLKIHYCSDDIANTVLSDLEQRYPETKPDLLPDRVDDYCNWDPGGLFMTGDTTVEFRLNKLTIRCKSQFLTAFCDAVSHYKDIHKDNVPSFVKIHGQYECVCINYQDFLTLCNLTEDKDMQEKAVLALREKQTRLDKLHKDNLIIQVQQDENGNIYKVNSDKDSN